MELEKDGCLVLLYHKVVPKNQIEPRNNSWTVASEDFFKQINFLKEQGVQFITMQELESYVKGSGYLPGKYAVVTFDDADSSIYHYAFPTLQQLQIPFALFVISGQVGNPNYKGLTISTWDEIRVMMNSGLATVGSHTHNLHFKEQNGHAFFLNPDNIGVFATDLYLSLDAIERETGQAPHYFSYPYGFGIPETDEVLLAAGIRLVLSCRAGTVQPQAPAFFIKRVAVNEQTWPAIAHWAGES